jgi:hypothetical protein
VLEGQRGVEVVGEQRDGKHQRHRLPPGRAEATQELVQHPRRLGGGGGSQPHAAEKQRIE